MKRDALTRLRILSALEDQAARDALRRAGEAEAALAAEARELDTLRKDAIASEGLDEARRAAGADAAWQAWLGMRRTSVIGAQARARAEIESATETALRVFARARMAERLEAEALQVARREQANAETRRLEALEITRRFQDRSRRPGGRSR